MRAMPSATDRTVPDLGQVGGVGLQPLDALPQNACDLVWLDLHRVLVPPYAARRDALSKFLQATADARVEDHVSDLQHDAAEDLRHRRGSTARPPRRSGVRPRAPILSTTAGSSSTALVTVTSRRRFSCFQSSSYSRRMRKISGIRCFLDQQLEEVDRAPARRPTTARPSPSSFSGGGEVGAEEEDLQLTVCRRRRRRTAPSCYWTASSLPFSLPASKRASAYTRASAPASASSPTPTGPRSRPRRRASSTSRFWSSAASVLRVTFSVARTVRSATSLRIWSSERRVSASMSRFACGDQLLAFLAARRRSPRLRPSRPLCGRGP